MAFSASLIDAPSSPAAVFRLGQTLHLLTLPAEIRNTIYRHALVEDGAIAVGAQRPETRHKHYMGKPTRWLQCPRKSDIEQIKHLELALPAFDTKCMVAALENFQFDVFKRFGVFMAATKLHAMMLLWKGAEGGDDLDVDDPDLISLAGGYRIMAERRKKDARRRRRWQNNTEE